MKKALLLLLATFSLSGCVKWYHNNYNLPPYDPTMGITQKDLTDSLYVGASFIHHPTQRDMQTHHTEAGKVCIWRSGFRNCYDFLGKYDLYKNNPELRNRPVIAYGPEQF